MKEERSSETSTRLHGVTSQKKTGWLEWTVSTKPMFVLFLLVSYLTMISVSRLYSARWWDDTRLLMKWKGFGRKRS
jgi:hypothetical protein